MNLKENYKKMCSDYNFLSKYSELGKGKYGRIFSFQDTNNRNLLSFISNYITFKEGADGIDRTLWERNDSHGQEMLKQHSVRMIKSKFFSKNERTYYKTRKGEVLEKISDNFNEAEKWIIIYLLLIDSYFDNIPNYILIRTKEIFEDFLIYENSEEKIEEIIKDFIEKSKVLSIEELFKHDYIYFDTFHKSFKDYDFLSNYLNSTNSEKEDLYNYIVSNYQEQKDLLKKIKSSNESEASLSKNLLLNFKQDVFSQKYKPGGNYNKNMVKDNAKILLISNYINKNSFIDFTNFIHSIIEKYSEIENVNQGKIYQFIFNDFKDIFEMVYINIFNPDYFDNISISQNINFEDEKNILEKVQNITIIENIEDITRVSSILKKKALERANYRCELEDICNCSTHYFTNKKNNKNYVELHHLIPREFSNDFEKSIEQIENYVCLCPRCHRFIHFAVDRERKMVLHYLYLKRIGSLKMKGIGIEESILNNYYRIEE